MAKPIASKEYVINKLAVYDVKAEKKYGQNFLIDDALALKIVEALQVSDGDEIIEIGPGLGALSSHLAEMPNNLYLVELDPVMAEHLKSEFTNENVFVINEDILRYKFSNHTNPLRVIGNLPYYITTAIIEMLLIENSKISKMVLMVQKEAFDRLVAKKGSKEYGPISIFIEYLGGAKTINKVSRHAYVPEPHVDSLVFSIEINKKRIVKNEKKFFEITKALFLMRRKTILNNLTAYLQNKTQAQEILTILKVDYLKRPEELGLEFYIELAERLS